MIAPKPVYDGAALLGQAATREEVVMLLVDAGHTLKAARDIDRTRCVEAPDRFHIVTPGSIEQMMADVRKIRGAA